MEKKNERNRQTSGLNFKEESEPIDPVVSILTYWGILQYYNIKGTKLVSWSIYKKIY